MFYNLPIVYPLSYRAGSDQQFLEKEEETQQDSHQELHEAAMQLNEKS